MSWLWPFLGLPDSTWAGPQSRLYLVGWISSPGLESRPWPAWVSQGLSCLGSELPYYGQPVPYHTNGSRQQRLKSDWALSRVACVSQQVGNSSEVSAKFSSQVLKSARALSRVAGISPGIVSGPSLSQMKDCTVNSLNEGLRFQHFQNALPEVQINSTGSYCESRDAAGSYKSWKNTWGDWRNGQAVGLNLHLFLIFVNGRHVCCLFKLPPISLNFALGWIRRGCLNLAPMLSI